MRQTSLKLASLFFIVFLFGCMEDSKEIDQRTMVVGMGIELTDEDEYEVTLQMPVIVPQFIPGGGGQEGSEFETLKATDSSLWDAISNIEAKTPTVLFFGHLKSVIIGEKLAREGITEAIDLIDRRAPVDNGVHLLIASEDEKVFDILSFESPLTSLPSLYIDRFFEAEQKMARVDEVQLYEFRRDSNMIGHAGHIPMIYVNDTYTIQDHAIFQDKKMVDILKDEESSVSSLLKEEHLDNFNYTIQVPFEGYEDVSVSLRIDTELDVEVENMNPNKFLVTIRGNAQLIHIMGEEKVESNRDFIRKVEEAVEKSLEDDLNTTIDKMKETNVDPWLFGHRLWIKDHENFNEEEWMKEGWRESEITIEIDIEIEETGQRSLLNKKKIGR